MKEAKETKAVGNPSIIPSHLRGVIKGSLPPRTPRLGGDITNAEYAKVHGISKRQASRKRRGW